jgi:hypothetical protein
VGPVLVITVGPLDVIIPRAGVLTDEEYVALRAKLLDEI